MATRRKKPADEAVLTQAPVIEPEAAPVVEREYEQYDLIPCRSLTSGTLYIDSTVTKSSNTYEWSDFGDVREIEYQDLIAMKQRHSAFIYRPTFMIEDKELLAQPRWRDVAALYKSLFPAADIEKLLRADANTLRKTLKNLLPAVQMSVSEYAADMIESGKLDSITKIKVIDEVCGTELYKLAFKK